MIDVTEHRLAALARLDVFVGDWVLEARFGDGPGGGADGPQVRSRFEWILDGKFLVQHTGVPVPGAPDSMAIVSADPRTGRYTQHYYDSRGVVRLYAMSLEGGVWTLTREAADFTPLDFPQRFAGTFSDDGNTITGAWEKDLGAGWEQDFVLIYRRAGE